MEFINKSELLNTWKLDEVDFDKIYVHMKALEADVMYILREDELAGVISIGDFLRYYFEDQTLKINTNYKYVDAVDEQQFYKLVTEIPSIHELPFVNQGKFYGVVREGRKSKEELSKCFRSIEEMRSGGFIYEYERFREWVKKQECRIVCSMLKDTSRSEEEYIPDYTENRRKGYWDARIMRYSPFMRCEI